MFISCGASDCRVRLRRCSKCVEVGSSAGRASSVSKTHVAIVVVVLALIGPGSRVALAPASTFPGTTGEPAEPGAEASASSMRAAPAKLVRRRSHHAGRPGSWAALDVVVASAVTFTSRPPWRRLRGRFS
jgi:hypothetical protein